MKNLNQQPMQTKALHPVVSIQQQIENYWLPAESTLVHWLTTTLKTAGYDLVAEQRPEVCLRIVDETESQLLNCRYRQLDKPTNVLAFTYQTDLPIHHPLLGDIVICAPVVEREAIKQHKTLAHHWAHMVVHGVLHLLGYDHLEAQQAEQMEALEIQILANLQIASPY
jgi:probable rRNA maturation factor